MSPYWRFNEAALHIAGQDCPGFDTPKMVQCTIKVNAESSAKRMWMLKRLAHCRLLCGGSMLPYRTRRYPIDPPRLYCTATSGTLLPLRIA
jgi:hypothetical protein